MSESDTLNKNCKLFQESVGIDLGVVLFGKGFEFNVRAGAGAEARGDSSPFLAPHFNKQNFTFLSFFL